MSKIRIALFAALFAPLIAQAQSFESAANVNSETNVVPSGPIAAAPTAVLFDQGPLTNGTNGATPISILQNVAPFNYCTLGASGAGATRLAEDFVVPAGQTWTIDTITVFGYQTSAVAASINNATLRILDGSPAGTPATLFGDTTTNRVGTTALSGAFRVASTTPTLTNRAIQAIPITVAPALVLQPGTYWIDFNAAGTVASGPFFPFVVPNNAAPAATGNALQFTTAWAALAMGVDPTLSCAAASTTPGPLQGLPFRVDGTSASLGAPTITPATPAGAVSFTLPGTRSFVFNNAAGATASGTVTCTISGAGFSVTPITTQTIAPGASTTFTVSAAAAGTGTLSCVVQGIAQPVVYNLTAGAPVALIRTPTLSLWSALALLMGLGLFGALTVRRVS